MGGLGNGRRGGRSPPLLIAALIACILVLGFNYWVSSSRNLELQTKLYELEGQVRRGAAERGVAEMKKTEFQEEIQRQKEQISHIENLYKTQLEGAQTSCSQDKVLLQQNISSSTKTIQELKGQLNQLNDNVGQLQKELQSCQSSLKTLDNKLTYDMTHCNSQVLSQKELCEERVAAAKLEAQKKIDKLLASQTVNVDVLEKASSNETKLTSEHTQSPSQTRDQTRDQTQDQTRDQTRDQPLELLSNSILETNEVAAVHTSDHVLSKQAPVSAPTAAEGKQDLPPPPGGAEEATKALESNTTDDKEMELMDTKDESHTDDPGMEDMLLTEGKADEGAQKVDLQDEYDTDQEMAPEKQKPSKRENLDQEEEDLADYNGDDENEGEFEADKQAALAQT